MTSDEPNEPHDRTGYAVNADFWVKIIRDGLDPYRTELTDERMIAATHPCRGQRILDAGCGEGYLSRAFARREATVVGIDACAEFIDAAVTEAEAQGLNIDHHVASAADLPLDDSLIDVVVCNHLLTDLEDLDGPLDEFGRVLKPGGRIVILMLHPCFYVARAERSENSRSFTAEEYFSRRTLDQAFNVAGLSSPATVRQWFRPLEDYTNALTQAAFAITGLSEPHPSAELASSNQWWQDNFPRPLFLLIEATKLPVR